MVTNVCVKFNYDRFRIYKALGSFRKSENNKNNVRSDGSAWGPGPKMTTEDKEVDSGGD